MTLKGIVEDVFNGQLIFRGYASIKDLARISTSENYQRATDDNRVNELVDYLNKGSIYKFFPELIFGLQFKDANAITAIRSGGNITFTDNIKLKKGKFIFGSSFPERLSSAKVMSLEFSTEIKYLNRIDGNHRLSAVEKILDNPDEDTETTAIKQKISSTVVPFSILLQTKADVSNKYEAAFFYLINSRSKALTTEENLKSILSNPDFTKQEQEELLQINSEYTLKIIEHISKSEYKFVLEIFYNEIYTLSLELSNLIQDGIAFDKIVHSLRFVDDLFVSKKITNPKRNIVLSLIKLKIERSENEYNIFQKWLVNNDLVEIEQIKPTKIIDIFDRMHKKRIYKVFVAMPYISFKRVNDFNKLFKEVLKDIEKKEDIKLELIPIMRFRGSSQRIDSRLIQKIKECDIFVADLSTCNDNVVFEVGLAEGNNKPMILIKSEEDRLKVPFEQKGTDNVPFDMDKLQWIPYSDTGYYNDIKSIIKTNLPEILKTKYGE